MIVVEGMHYFLQNCRRMEEEKSLHLAPQPILLAFTLHCGTGPPTITFNDSFMP
jgi:hypothetical protein